MDEHTVDTDRMRHLACIATAVMEPAVMKNERLSPTSPADVTRATFPRIEPPPSTLFNTAFQPFDTSSSATAASPGALPSLLLRQHHPHPHTPLHEKQAQHLLWKAQEQELMRRQRQIIALKEKQQAIRRRAAAAVAASAANRNASMTGSRKGAPQHHLQELFMQQQREQREQEDAMRLNLVHLNYHRMLAEEDLERLQHQESSHASMQHAYLLAQKSTVFDAAVVHATSSAPSARLSPSRLASMKMPSTAASTSAALSASSMHQDDRLKRSPLASPVDATHSILQYMLPPVVPHRAGLNIKDVSLNELRPHFNKPMAAVAKELGVCITLMKKICRKNGLTRWPHRRIRSLVNRITSLQVVAESVDAGERGRFHVHIANLRKELSDVIQNPNGKSRKARGYDRKKASAGGDSDNESSGSSSSSRPTTPRDMDDDDDEDDLCCTEEIDAGSGASRRIMAPFHGGGKPSLPSLFQAAREA